MSPPSRVATRERAALGYVGSPRGARSRHDGRHGDRPTRSRRRSTLRRSLHFQQPEPSLLRFERRGQRDPQRARLPSASSAVATSLQPRGHAVERETKRRDTSSRSVAGRRQHGRDEPCRRASPPPARPCPGRRRWLEGNGTSPAGLERAFYRKGCRPHIRRQRSTLPSSLTAWASSHAPRRL